MFEPHSRSNFQTQMLRLVDCAMSLYIFMFETYVNLDVVYRRFLSCFYSIEPDLLYANEVMLYYWLDHPSVKCFLTISFCFQSVQLGCSLIYRDWLHQSNFYQSKSTIIHLSQIQKRYLYLVFHPWANL